jgi:hypothetical protein
VRHVVDRRAEGKHQPEPTFGVDDVHERGVIDEVGRLGAGDGALLGDDAVGLADAREGVRVTREPEKAAIKGPTYARNRSTVSRSGSTVMKRTRTRAARPPSWLRTWTISDRVSGQTSGQNVYPKNRTTARPRCSRRRNVEPSDARSEKSGAGCAGSSTPPRNGPSADTGSDPQ